MSFKSISYAAESEIRSDAFVMCATIPKGFALWDVLSHSDSPLKWANGPRIVAELEKLGYTTIQKPYAPKFEVISSFFTDRYDSVIGT